MDQLLESVDLDFEPRFITKDGDEDVAIHKERPTVDIESEYWDAGFKRKTIGPIKLAEFENKPWQECIYEVPRKTTGNENEQKMLAELERKLNAIVDAAIEAVNELKGAKNE